MRSPPLGEARRRGAEFPGGERIRVAPRGPFGEWYTDMMLVKRPDHIRLAMLGMVPGNGHPYSWSAIFNGFEPEAMRRCPYPAIFEYLSQQPAGAFGIPGAHVTHVWCDDPKEAWQVAEAAFIPEVVDDPADVVGQVDAVIIPTDWGHEHVARVRPFLEAGLPAFIDKPLVDRVEDLRQFVAWERAGKAFLSTSALRFAREYAACRDRLPEVGRLRLITMTMAKSWERYGIHALEGVYPFLPAGGWMDVVNSGQGETSVVHAHHELGVDVVLAVIPDLTGAFGCLNVYGSGGMLSARFADTFHAFKAQLEQFIAYLRTGVRPVPFSETVELMKLVIAGIRSREERGRRVLLDEIKIDGENPCI